MYESIPAGDIHFHLGQTFAERKGKKEEKKRCIISGSFFFSGPGPFVTDFPGLAGVVAFVICARKKKKKKKVARLMAIT